MAGGQQQGTAAPADPGGQTETAEDLGDATDPGPGGHALGQPCRDRVGCDPTHQRADPVAQHLALDDGGTGVGDGLDALGDEDARQHRPGHCARKSHRAILTAPRAGGQQRPAVNVGTCAAGTRPVPGWTNW
ncbi:hypothetical protein SDC9_140618 [bioreactor metagenome]|uniref:Uncharacterized protein n=1 Tax=bioreactor metagenome TaxID=1076179 RepID=A0A645DVX1_9ZZZZ